MPAPTTEQPTTAELLRFAHTLADTADAVGLEHFRSELEVNRKADGTLVTAADLRVEALLRARIAERYPAHAVLGEEQGDSPASDSATDASASGAVRWILDPIDGTHNYVRGIPVWATLIACERDGVIEVGVASAPALDTRWWAGRGLGAFRGAAGSGTGVGEPIHVSDRASVGEAQLLYGSHRLTMEAWGGRAAGLLDESWRQRGFGDFWGHCLVAEGAAEVMLEGEIAPWDIAALLPIVEEAGGRLTDIEGTARIDGGHCITTNGHLHEQVLRRLQGG